MKKISKKKISAKLSKQHKQLLGLGGFLVLASFVLSSCDLNNFVRFRDFEEPEVITHIFDIPGAITLQRSVDGAPVEKEEEQNILPAAIIIENAADSWPLSGVDDAQIVYEALAESFIPRLLAIYATHEEVEKIGPVRSARPYFVDWAEGYQGLFMHVGGSDEGIRRAKFGEVVDIDEFRYGGTYYWRSNGRLAPHNVYTSTDLISDIINDKDLDEVPEYRMWSYTDETPLDARPEEVEDVVVNFTTETYKARWKYDRETNEYVRYQNERVFLTLEGDEIRAKNIIVSLNQTSVIDAIGRKEIVTVGDGDAWIFRNGEAIEGSWEKEDEDEREIYLDSEGNEVELVGGTTWIEVIPNANMLEY